MNNIKYFILGVLIIFLVVIFISASNDSSTNQNDKCQIESCEYNGGYGLFILDKETGKVKEVFRTLNKNQLGKNFDEMKDSL
jgi:hypothetical protein